MICRDLPLLWSSTHLSCSQTYKPTNESEREKELAGTFSTLSTASHQSSFLLDPKGLVLLSFLFSNFGHLPLAIQFSQIVTTKQAEAALMLKDSTHSSLQVEFSARVQCHMCCSSFICCQALELLANTSPVQFCMYSYV